MESLSRTYPSARGERISPSSLLPERSHHPHLLELQNMPVNWDIADYCIHYIIGILAPYRHDTEAHRLRSVFFGHIVANVLSRPEVGMTTILVALCFIRRISWGFQNHLDIEMEKQWDGEDLLLGALITANKSLNDSVWSLKSWAEWTKVLSSKTLQRAERNFLRFIDYDISVSETELLAHYDGIMEYGVRKRGGWYGLMDIGHQNGGPQRDASPRSYPAPIGSGRPRATPHQQHQAPPVARLENKRPEYYLQPPHPSTYVPSALPPPPPPLWQPEVVPPQSPYPRRDRRRSRSPPARRSRALRTPARFDRSWERSPRFAYNHFPSHHTDEWGRHARDGYRLRYLREHVLGHYDESHSRRAHRYPSRTPYDGDRYYRHSRGRGSSRGRSTPLRGVPGLHEVPDTRSHQPHPHALLFGNVAGNRRYEDPRPRLTPPSHTRYHWHGS